MYVCVCELASLADKHTYAPLRCLCFFSAAASASADSDVASFVYIFFLCHFDWKIVRNWKFLLLAVRSIHTHTYTHTDTQWH